MSNPATNTPRLRSACDICHQLKVRCSGGLPCERCVLSDNVCFYSVANRLGRPKGAKNKRPASSRQPTGSDANKTITLSGNNHQADRPRIPKTKSNENITLSRQHLQQLQQLQQLHKTHPTPPPSDSPTPPLPPSTMDEDTSYMISPQMIDMVMTGSTETRTLSWGPGPYDVPSILDESWDYTSPHGSLTGNAFSTGQKHDQVPDMVPTPSHNQYSTASDIEASMSSSAPTLVATVGSSPSSTGDVTVNHVLGLSQFACKMGSGIGCSCLQQHTELLCSLKRSRLLLDSESRSSRQISRVLRDIEEVLVASKALAECQDCAVNDDQEVLLLSVMCIRAVVSQLQRISWNPEGSAESGTNEDGAANSRGSLRTADMATTGERLTTTDNDVQLLVGEFEVTGNDKSILLQVLKSITLRKIEAVLGLLKDTESNRRKRLQASHNLLQHPSCGNGSIFADYQRDNSNSAHMQKMMQDMMQYIKVLQSN